MKTKPEPLSLIVSGVRDKLVEARRELNDAARDNGFKDRLENVSGLLTCGISVLYEYRQSIAKFEVEVTSAERGKHLRFVPRGVGKDICPGCFVCGAAKRNPKANEYLHNISGYVQSKEDGETIITWFGGRARLDIGKGFQLKFGACDQHLPNLKKLGDVTNEYGVIREIDIKECMEFVEVEQKDEAKPQLDSELAALAEYLATQFPATVGHLPLKEKLASISSRLKVPSYPLLVMSENDSSAKCPCCGIELVRLGHLFVTSVKSKSRLRKLSNRLMCLGCEKDFNFLVT